MVGMSLLVFLLIYLLFSKVESIPDNMCYYSTVATYARPILGKVTAETQRGCLSRCANDGNCAAFSFSDPNCTLLGSGRSSSTCTKPGNILAKKSSNCPVRTDPMEEMGEDPCVNDFYPSALTFASNGICPRDSNNYVVRGIDEFGARVTLDNDIMNVLTFNATRNMWRFTAGSSNFTKWLVAVSCATAGETCGCGSLPMVSLDTSSSKNAASVRATGACGNSLNRIAFYCEKFPGGSAAQFLTLVETTKTTITCQAGIWLLSYLDNSNGWKITSATCTF